MEKDIRYVLNTRTLHFISSTFHPEILLSRFPFMHFHNYDSLLEVSMTRITDCRVVSYSVAAAALEIMHSYSALQLIMRRTNPVRWAKEDGTQEQRSLSCVPTNCRDPAAAGEENLL